MKVSAEVLAALEFDRIKEMVSARAASILGRRVSSRMRPIDDAEQVRRCLRQTTEMSRIIMERERFPLAGLADIEERMRAAQKKGQPMDPGDLRDFASTFETAEAIRNLLSSPKLEAPALRALASRLMDFPKIRREVARVIDSKGKIRDDATVSLRKIRIEIQTLRGKIREKLETLLADTSFSRNLQDRRIALRGERFVLAVKSVAKGRVEGILHDRSQSGATIYVEPKEVVELGNALTEAFVDEAKEVSKILWEITRQIYAQAEEVLQSCNILAWMDFTHAKARMTIEYDLEEPRMGETLDIRGARHPILMEILGKEKVVPISIRLNDGERAMVITGPNNGGKTVALKAIGLLVAMAHAGLHVPCLPGSSIPFYPSLFADIGDEQSLETSLSTYSSHMARIVKILGEAVAGSLVLIDELGSGTDPSEGAALGEAILADLIRKEAEVLVSTHLGSLKEFAFKEKGAVNAAVEFDPDTLAPLYRISIGAPGNSQALAIARRLGIPERVAKMAEETLAADGKDGRDLIGQIQEIRLDTEKAREKARDLEQRTREEEERARQTIREAEAMKEAISREADGEMESAFRSVRKLVEEYEGEMRAGPAHQAEKARNLRESIEAALSHTPFGEKRQAFAAGLKKGKRVFLIKFRQEGQISRVNRNKQRLTVQLGRVLVETGFDDVSWINEHGRPVNS